MKLTKHKLKKIIKEELHNIMREDEDAKVEQLQGAVADLFDALQDAGLDIGSQEFEIKQAPVDGVKALVKIVRSPEAQALEMEVKKDLQTKFKTMINISKAMQGG